MGVPFSFTIFLYIRPDIKVKLYLVMVIGIDDVLFAYVDYHALVAQKSDDFHCFVVTNFDSLRAIPFFHLFRKRLRGSTLY